MAEKVLTLPRKRGFDVLGLVPSGRSLLLALAGVSIAVGLYGLARETSLFAVRSVEVEGASASVAADVRAALRSYEGRSLVAVDAGAVEQRADALPAVRSAVVDRAFPHTIRIRIAPEVPVAVLRRGSESWLVSARGRVIQPIEREEMTKSGIVLPDTAKEKPTEGKVVAVGEGRVNDEGKRVPLAVKPGDRVLFGSFAGTAVKESGKEYLILEEHDLLGVIDDKPWGGASGEKSASSRKK